MGLTVRSGSLFFYQDISQDFLSGCGAALVFLAVLVVVLEVEFLVAVAVVEPIATRNKSSPYVLYNSITPFPAIKCS